MDLGFSETWLVAPRAPRGDDAVAIIQSVFSAVLKIGLLVAVGVRLEKQKMLDGSKRKCLSALAMDVCLPCLLFSSVLPKANLHLLHEGWPLLLWPFVYAVVGAALGVLCCTAVGIPSQHIGAAAACAAFPNVNGFPVAIIAALGSALPNSPTGFSALVFLSLIQLTDGIIKYTLGPVVFRRDLHAARGQVHIECETLHGGADGMLPVGSSLASIMVPSRSVSFDEKAPDCQDHDDECQCAFGLNLRQVRAVEPEWSRYDAYKLFRRILANSPPSANNNSLRASLLSNSAGTPIGDFLRKLFPPQVTAVVVALAIGVGPPFLKALLVAPEGSIKHVAPLGFIYGTAVSLGGGFVPLQMISLGGRLVNVFSSTGPLAATGAAGPGGRSKLLRIAAAVGVARMILTPAVLYFVAQWANALLKSRGDSRPMAFWAPALIVAAMPTANNMSTMADLIGSGRSISSASTALQLLVSPLVLAISLTFVLAGATCNLANDVDLDSD